MAAHAHETHQSGRIAHHQPVRHDIFGYHCRRPYESKAPHRYTRQHNRPRPNRRSVLDANPAHLPVRILFQLPFWGDCPREPVIGQAGMRADENAILNGSAAIDRGTILNLDPIADGYTRVNVDALAKDARLTNARSLTNLSLVPDLGTLAYPGQRRDFGREMDLHA